MTQFVILALLGLAAIGLVYWSNKTNKLSIIWLGSLLPPLVLIALIWVPFDSVSSVLWLPALIAAVLAAVRMLWYLLQLIWRVLKRDLSAFSKKWPMFIRAILTVALFLFASSMVRMSVFSANHKALQQAFETHQTVMMHGRCPDSIDGWDAGLLESAGSQQLSYGDFGTKYVISYLCAGNKRFSFDVQIDHDSTFNINFDPAFAESIGNESAMRVSYGNDSDKSDLTIDAGADLAALAKMPGGKALMALQTALGAK